MNSKYMNMSVKDFVNLLEKKEKENQELRNKIIEINSNIKKIGNQNRRLKRKCERYQERLTEVLYKGTIKNCSTCKNNVEYSPAHTCDICTSLDQEDDYEMWEPK